MRQHLKKPFNLKVLFSTLLFLIPLGLFAHVKWFTEGSYSDKPMALKNILVPDFWWLFALTVAVIALGVLIDHVLEKGKLYGKINDWLQVQSQWSVLIMRITVAMVLMLSWQADSMLVPNVVTKYAWIGWYQFVLAFLVIIPRTYRLGGFGVIVLYFMGHILFSTFHMLDYMVFFGVGWYLMFEDCEYPILKKSALTMLYLTLGFSLFWVGLEKFIYPEWAYSILEKNPQLMLGLPMEFFLRAAAFIEIGLGYLLISNMLNRPLAVIITIVFFLTTTVFGKTEVVGHTILHGSLIVFLLSGRSAFGDKIIRTFKPIWARMLVTVLGLIVLFPILLFSYNRLADQKYNNRSENGSLNSNHGHSHAPYEVPSEFSVPSVEMEVHLDSISGYNIHLKTENFVFAPQMAGLPNEMPYGHAHLYVDDVKIARVYSNWYHMPPPPPGEHKVVITLHGNMHSLLTKNGVGIGDTVTIEVPGNKSRMK